MMVRTQAQTGMRRKPVRKPKLVPILLAAAALLAGAIIITAQRPTGSTGSATNDLAYVWGLTASLASQQAGGSDVQMDQRRWIVRYDVEQLDNGQALQVANLLGLQRSRHDGQDAEQAGLAAYDGMMPIEGEGKFAQLGNSVPVTMAVDPDKSRFEGAILVMKPEAGISQERLTAAARRIEQALHETGAAFAYSFRVASSIAANTMPVSGESEMMKPLFDALTAQAGAALVESYADSSGRTISETWRSPHLEASILTKDKKANLQLSRHQNDTANTIDWIVGVPIITGDYAQSE
nr:YwmB family TATA-box binding protein [Paenibacillus sp. MMS18-CY102]